MMMDDDEDIVTYEYEPCKEATVVFDEHDVPGNKRKSTFPARKAKMIMMVAECFAFSLPFIQPTSQPSGNFLSSSSILDSIGDWTEMTSEHNLVNISDGFPEQSHNGLAGGCPRRLSGER